MVYRLQFRPYQRSFVRSLSTSHGNWKTREGIILKLIDETGAIGWGEIAPLPWFGSETLTAALDFCSQLGKEITRENIFSIPDRLPASQFGFQSAWSAIKHPQKLNLNLKFSGLLPTGEAALDTWQNLWQQGYRTFKWKIGILPIAAERDIFQQLIQALPKEAKLRLDANGGLSFKTANEWLETCDYWQIEFLEQPLAVGEEKAMLELSKKYSTPLALDESVATVTQLKTCYQLGWPGIFVIKPCIVGSPFLLRKFCRENNLDVVFSSVFETTIGRQAALKLASELSPKNRALGFGINHWFKEDEKTWLASLWETL
ncbi:o-succinylbenzoate synthase [Aerosakkonemataceae cyanobacterium BLCC-F154]|uniref:o-succinylbenzoate synthase n=1 Tax=Floridaenema fluviatile BLCC-F154 TaxID=3153640 RepID=A0ABV4YJG1_9CYAN